MIENWFSRYHVLMLPSDNGCATNNFVDLSFFIRRGIYFCIYFVFLISQGNEIKIITKSSNSTIKLIRFQNCIPASERSATLFPLMTQAEAKTNKQST